MAKKKKAPDGSKPCRVKGCTRLFIPRKGCADGACAMHYRRFKRTGAYGSAAPEIVAGEKKKAIKVYAEDDLTDRIRRLAKNLGTTVSEWCELVLDKESKAAERRHAERAISA